MTQFKSLLDFAVSTGPRGEIDLVHATCSNGVMTWLDHWQPVALDEIVRAAADHECPDDRA